MSATMVAGLVTGTLAAGLYLSVAALLADRMLRLRSWPLAGLTTFWFGVGAYALADSLMTLLWIAGASPLAAGIVSLHWKVVAITAAFAGLVAYLGYVYFGSRAVVGAVLVWYVGVALGFEAWYAMRVPVGMTAHVWGVSLAYAYEPAQSMWYALLVALVAPGLVAAGMYARLVRHAKEPEMRRRIRGTSFALALFFAPTLLAWIYGKLYWWGLIEKLLGITTAIVMLVVAFPAWRASREPDGAMASRPRAKSRPVDPVIAARLRQLL